MRQFAMGLVVAAAVSLPFSSALAKASRPDATLQLNQGSVAAGIGFSWGGGTLTYQGKRYPVSVDGLTVGSVGISRATAAGSVYNPKKPQGLNCPYTPVRARA